MTFRRWHGATCLLVTTALVGCGGNGGSGNSSVEKLIKRSVTPGAVIASGTVIPQIPLPPPPGPLPGPPPAPPPPPFSFDSSVARLFADVNRDGQINQDDDADRDKWTTTRGAVFAYNNDDDDRNRARDSADNQVNGPDDLRTMTKIVVARITSKPNSVALSYAPANAPIRIYAKNATGGFTQILAPGTTQAALTGTGGAPTELYLEATGPRSRSWEGFINLTLTVFDKQNTIDMIRFNCAPLIYTDNTRPAERVYSMRIQSQNLPFWNALSTGLAAQGIPLSNVDETTYGTDRWVQDQMQIGYQGYLGPTGYAWITDFNQLERYNGAAGTLWGLVPGELLAPKQGMSYGGQGPAEACNFGGNIEVLPPHTDPTGKDWSFGRVFVGGGSRGSVTGQTYSRFCNPQEIDLLEGQRVQGPVLTISSEWLAVGHVDEFSMVVRDFNSAGGRSWKMFWASPALARKALSDLKAKGQGAAKVFAGRRTETTVDAILADTNLMAFNDQVQTRLDSIKQQLMTAVGLTAADFIELPVFFEVHATGGINYAVAANPGVVNGIPVNDTFYMPDPEGPVDTTTGVDVFKTQINAAVAAIGQKVKYVDVFDSYHLLLGEAHCGSNVVYKAYDAPWWSK